MKLPFVPSPYPWKKYHLDIWLLPLMATSVSKHDKVEYQQPLCNYMQMCQNTWKVMVQTLKILK